MRQYLFPNFKSTSLHGIYNIIANEGKKGARFKIYAPFLLNVITPGFRNILKCGLKSISFGFTLWIMHDDWLVYFCSIRDRRLMSTIKLYSHSLNEASCDPFFIQELEQRFFFLSSSKNYNVFEMSMILGR